MDALEKPLMGNYFPLAYYLSMTGDSLRQRILDGMAARSMTKADLSRRSGVPYHALDKFLKGKSASTSAENARALCNALGVAMDGEAEYEELRALFFQLPEEKREFLLASIRGLVAPVGG
jgi:transcriptional regulator with XRE-family HTH domain